jgi:carboxypeptidase T
VLKLTNSAIAGDQPKLFITAAIHAREYATAELATRFAEYLVDNYGVDADATWLLDHHGIHAMFLANPDGRKKAEAGASWRKNTDNDDGCTSSGSWGVDLNRNFTYQWGGVGASSSPCNETYRGSSASSEPEIQAIQDYMDAIFSDQRGPYPSDLAPADATGLYFDLDSYSEFVLWPWGYTGGATPNSSAFQTLGRKIAYFNGYTPDQWYSGLYPSSCIEINYAYGALGVAALEFEVGTSFFQSCSYFESTPLPKNLPALV